jgi:uncharacterized membrane protein
MTSGDIAVAAPRRTTRRSLLRAAVRARRVWRRVKRRLAWGRVYRLTSYLQSALWTVPLIAIVLVLVAVPLLRWLDGWLQWEFNALAPSGATALYQTVITLTLSFVVFTFGSLLVAIQVAGGQLTPRIIATTLLRDNVVRYSVGLFVFALVFAVMALNRQDAHVSQLVAFVTAALGIACIADFLFLIDYAARLLRPVSVVASVGDSGVEVIRAVYRFPASGDARQAAPLLEQLGPPSRIVAHAGKAGIVLAADLATLVSLARRHGGVLEFLPEVGDFVALDDPLFAVYGGASAIDDRALRATVAFGPERTLEQDPMFAFRIIVDIALKALSPAINDPTTAVLALDQIHRLLRMLGKRELRGEVLSDEAGEPRLVFRTPNWDDFVHVACSEIRACGGNSMQIVRRMRAMLDNVMRMVPERRRPSLVRELRLLDLTIDASFALPEDRELARIADPQGLGGSAAAPRLGRRAP